MYTYLRNLQTHTKIHANTGGMVESLKPQGHYRRQCPVPAYASDFQVAQNSNH